MRRKLVSGNPFENLSSGSTPADDLRYVTAALPDAESKLLFRRAEARDHARIGAHASNRSG
jgi:hypothetical protein